MSGLVSYQKNRKELNKYHDGIQILLFLPVASCRPNMGVSGWCLRVSGSVWMVSENVIQMSGVCRCIVNWNQSNKYHDYQILLFLPVVACRGVSDGCLDGVWGCMAVLAWCLSVSGSVRMVSECVRQMSGVGWWHMQGQKHAETARLSENDPQKHQKRPKNTKTIFSPKQPNKIGSNLECGLSHIPTS